jgi:hypothetical protein
MPDGIVEALMGVFGVVLGVVLSYYLNKRRMSDKDLFQVWRVAFDRPAFKGKFSLHSDPLPFKKAIDDTIDAVNTGYVSSRSGKMVEQGKGKGYIRNNKWRTEMDWIEMRLKRINELTPSSTPVDPVIAAEIDRERDEIIIRLNGIWRALDISERPVPTMVGYENVWPKE